MPYVYDPNLDYDDENKNQASGSSTQLTEGSSTAEASAASGANSQASNKKELNTGSGFQNLDKYLKTNQSQQFGNQLLGKVGDTINTAKQNQEQASNQFKNQVTQANYLPDEQKFNQSLAKPEEANAKDFQTWMHQSYQGPKSLSESQDAWNKYWSGTNQANTSAKLLGTEAGRFSLLDSYFGRPQYNFGEKSLDNLLVQQSGLGKETKAIQNQASQLKAQGEAQAKNLQGFAGDRAGQVEQNKNQVNQAFNQAQSTAQQDIASTLAQAKMDRAAQQKQFKDQVSSQQLTDAQLSEIGLSRGQNLYNLGLGDYVTLNDTPLTNEQVATDDQRARLNALSQLAGIQQTYLGGHQDMSKAYGFDTSKFAQAVANNKATYDADVNRVTSSTQERIDSIKNIMKQGRGLTVQVPGIGPLSNQDLINYYQNKMQKDLGRLREYYQADRKL